MSAYSSISSFAAWASPFLAPTVPSPHGSVAVKNTFLDDWVDVRLALQQEIGVRLIQTCPPYLTSQNEPAAASSPRVSDVSTGASSTEHNMAMLATLTSPSMSPLLFPHQGPAELNAMLFTMLDMDPRGSNTGCPVREADWEMAGLGNPQDTSLAQLGSPRYVTPGSCFDASAEQPKGEATSRRQRRNRSRKQHEEMKAAETKPEEVETEHPSALPVFAPITRSGLQQLGQSCPQQEDQVSVAMSRRSTTAKAKLWCHIYLEPAMLCPGFDMSKKIIGSGGCNTRSIYEATDAKVRLRGRGSGHIEEAGREAPVHLMLAITTGIGQEEAFVQAVEMGVNLIHKVTERFRHFCRQRSETCPNSLFWLGDVSAAGKVCLESNQVLADLRLELPKTGDAANAASLRLEPGAQTVVAASAHPWRRR